MVYPYLTLDDGTEIVHSEMFGDGTVKVIVEKPDEQLCFKHAICWLPGYRWEDVLGFTDEEIARYQEVIESTAHIIIELAQDGGFQHASGF